MKDIKFRARIDGKFYYFTLNQLRGHHASVPAMVYEYSGDRIETDLSTGLKDKNGAEIYGSDIVRSKEECSGLYRENSNVVSIIDGVIEGIPFKVVFQQGEGGGDRTYIEMCPAECEVVGNIYENPALLEGKK